MSYTLIERRELTEAASSIEFTGIPQFYTDLVIFTSLRNSSAGNQNGRITFNGSTSGYSERLLFGNGSSVSTDSASGSLINWVDYNPGTNATANTFGSSAIYIPNYTSSSSKSVSSDAVSENNGTTAIQYLNTALWNNSAPITSFAFTPSSGNFAAGSSISLYGINRQQSIGKPKAIGGAITFANGYWVHTFNASGSFISQENLNVDGLVVAGGGGGGSLGGGGGAGGFLSFSNKNLTAGVYTVVVGAGGSGSFRLAGKSGSNSVFTDRVAIGGGGGGSNYQNGFSGGSGGGAIWSTNGYSGTSGQGNTGGAGGPLGIYYTTGGGGGAGAVGTSGTGSVGGSGGAGLPWNGTFYAGGGGGGLQSRDGNNTGTPTISGGIGGGGRGAVQQNTGSIVVTSTSGEANTGGGGGGTGDGGTSSPGGSGIVIIRYPAN
jgi:hypothetical protein